MVKSVTVIVALIWGSLLNYKDVKGQTLTLQGPSFAVLDSSHQFTCRIPTYTTGLSVVFQRETGSVSYTACAVNTGTCNEHTSEDGYSCACVSGQTRVFYMAIASVSQQDDNDWWCIYSGQSSNTIRLDVYYPPTITSVPSTKTVTENTSPNINCSSNIIPGNPSSTSYRWTGPDDYSRTGAVLDRTVTRTQGGQYTCTVNNTAGLSDIALVNINVQYPPTIISIPSAKTVTENTSPNIDCSSNIRPGNPSSTSYRWTGPGGYSRTGAVLDRNVTRTQGGQYTCTATNTVGLDTAMVNINVQYLDRPVLTLDKSSVMENDTVNIHCKVVSNPTVQMKIKNIDNDTVVAQGNTNNLTSTIQRVQCLHKGTYVCSAENKGIEMVYRTEKEVNVLCMPRHDDRKPFVENIASGLDQVASLVASVISNPKPIFSWFRYINDQLIPIPNSTAHAIVIFEHESVLQITVSHIRDYGRYAALVENNLGKMDMLFTVSAVSPPLSPDKLTVGETTATTVSLRWKSNYNGGSEQTFNIEFQKSGNDWGLWEVGILDPGRGMWLNTTITNLRPGTQYYVQVYSKNLFGISAKVVREAETQGLQVEKTSERLEGIGIGIAAATPVIIGLIIALVVALRRLSSKMQGNSTSRDDELQIRNQQTNDVQSTYTDLKTGAHDGNEYEKLHEPNGATGSITEYQNSSAF